ncbi:hypothetical protein GEMRC1_008681 [Eukaryota sp. GEM-RC1]
MLKSNQFLQILKFHDCFFTEEIMIEITEALSLNNSLVLVQFSDVEDEEVLEVLSDAFKNNSVTARIDVSPHLIDSKSGKVIINF